MQAIKLLDSSSGNSNEFKSVDQSLTYRLVISGSPTANVLAFYQEKDIEFNGFFLKISCSGWNSATVKLQCKTSHEDDSFADTGDEFTKDELFIFKYN